MSDFRIGKLPVEEAPQDGFRPPGEKLPSVDPLAILRRLAVIERRVGTHGRNHVFGSGGDPVRTSQVLYGHGGNATVAIATTSWMTTAPTAAGALYNTEINAALTMPYDGLAQNLRVKTTGSQGAGGSLVVTVRKNSAATALTVTFAAGAAASVASDTTNTVAFAAGDRFDLEYANNDGAAVSATLGGWTLEYIRT